MAFPAIFPALHMKRIPVVFLALLGSLQAAVVLDFDTPGQFAANFSSGQSGPITQSASGGANGSGSLNLSGMNGSAATQQIITFNQAFSGDLESWSASIYYRGDALNFWQFGFTTEEAPALTEGWASQGNSFLPVILFASGSVDDGAIGFTSYSPSNPVNGGITDGQLFNIPGDLPSTNEWYQYSFAVEYLGLSQYSVEGTLRAANADGSLGAVLGTVSSTFTNPELAADDSVYLYINMYQGQAIDNFTTTVPEVSGAMLGSIGLVSGLLCSRRRKRD